MKKENMKIGLALSGGGMRAAVFHLGILKCLAEQTLLSKIVHISSVSGASICMGLICACQYDHWPTDHEFLNKTLPYIKEAITKRDIQRTSLLKLIIQPYYWDKKVNLLGKVMEQKWNLHCCLQDMAHMPTWTINTTAYETGKDFRISRCYMGEKHSGFVSQPRMRLSHAVAASAGFPILIGPYKLKTNLYTWVDEFNRPYVPQDRVLHLWDGGVYDNMGLDPLFHIGDDTHLSNDINYLIVSNASSIIEHKTRRLSYSVENLKRLLVINMDQVESLKSRNVVSHFKKHHNGIYIRMGTDMRSLLQYSDFSYEHKERMLQMSLSTRDVAHVAEYKTTLKKVSEADFEMIMRHGYELTDGMLKCFCFRHLS